MVARVDAFFHTREEKFLCKMSDFIAAGDFCRDIDVDNIGAQGESVF